MTDPEIEALALVFTHALRAAGCDAIDALAVLDLAVRPRASPLPVGVHTAR